MKQALNTQSSKHAFSNKCNAFHRQATLEEVAEADVLIHVMDGSSPQMLQQRQAVMHILRQLGKRDLPTRPRATGLICVPYCSHHKHLSPCATLALLRAYCLW